MVSIVQVFTEAKVSMMEHGGSWRYSAMLLSFSAQLKWILIYIGHTLVGSLPVEHKEDHSIVWEYTSRRAVGT